VIAGKGESEIGARSRPLVVVLVVVSLVVSVVVLVVVSVGVNARRLARRAESSTGAEVA